MQSIAQIQSTVTTTAAMATTVLPGSGGFTIGKKSKIGKSTFRLSPLRKVAKTAKINLNRYWGLFSQLYGNSGTGISTSSQKIAAATAFAEEMEQNRQNEILEAQTIASSQNSLNSRYEEDLMSYRSNSASSSNELQPIRGFVRQRCCLSHAHAHSLYSSFSSSLDSLQNEMDIVIMGSVDSLVSQENTFNM